MAITRLWRIWIIFVGRGNFSGGSIENAENIYVCYLGI